METETMCLRDPDVYPTPEVLRGVFGDAYPAYRVFADVVESETFHFTPEWRYYQDGKAWLCKITHRKKTVVWLSAGPGTFRLGFYFTEKSGDGIRQLDIADALKDDYARRAPIGRLKPLVIDVRTDADLADVYALLRYKVGTR